MPIEQLVQDAFVAWLVDRGWDVSTDNANHIDVLAHRGAERLAAEVKGTTTSAGLDVDTGYGQLLRRMVDDDHTRYGLVVPEAMAAAALRVPKAVRGKLGVTVFIVDDFGRVRTS